MGTSTGLSSARVRRIRSRAIFETGGIASLSPLRFGSSSVFLSSAVTPPPAFASKNKKSDTALIAQLL